MRILYFSFVELDVPNACQTHTLGVLRGFSHHGCQVDALVPRPIYVRPKIPNVRFFYLWPWQFSSLGRLWIKVLGFLLFFVLCLWNKYDAIYVRELEVNAFPRWCSIIFRIPFYIEINSNLLQNIAMCRPDNNLFLRTKIHQAADFKQARGLIVPSYPRCRWIIDYYKINPNRVHMILNGTDLSTKDKLDRIITLRKLNLPESAFYLGFLGNMWKSYDLVTIIEALEICQKQIPQIFLLMIGGGPELPKVQKIADTKGLTSKIIILGFVQPESLFEVIGAVDVGLMNLTKKGVHEAGPITTRFATYAAFQIPVVANNMYLKNYPDELVQGLSVVPPENPNVLADMILWLYNHPDERRDTAKILYDFVSENLTWESVTREILSIINHDKKSK